MTMDRVPGNGEPPLDTIFDLGKTNGKPVSKRTWKSTMIWIVAVLILGTVGTVLKIQWSEELTTARNLDDYGELPQATYEHPRSME